MAQELTTQPIVKPTANMPDLNSWILGFGAIGAGLQAYGTYAEGKAQAAALEYNSFIAEQDALQVEKYKKHELHKAKTAQRKLLARQIAITAASGRSFSGSPLDVMNRTESEALMDQEIIRSNAAVAKGRLYGQATMDRAGAKTAKFAARSRSLTGLMSSGANIYARSNYFKKKGK